MYDGNYRVLAYYYPASNKTYDADMGPVGRGELLMTLLVDFSAS